VFNKDVKVPLQEAELVGTSSSNIYFKLAKNSGRVGRGSGNGRGQGRGRETGYTSKPKTRTLAIDGDVDEESPGVSLAVDDESTRLSPADAGHRR
jgi:hypothetical protein